MKTHKLLNHIGGFLVIFSIALILLELFEINIISEYFVQKGRLFIMAIGFIFLAIGRMQKKQQEGK